MVLCCSQGSTSRLHHCPWQEEKHCMASWGDGAQPAAHCSITAASMITAESTARKHSVSFLISI